MIRKNALVIISVLFIFFLGSNAWGQVASIDSLDIKLRAGTDNTVDIFVPDSVNVAGAAFTIKCNGCTADPTIWVTSEFFETFAVQSSSAPNWTGDTSVNVGGTDYDQPLIQNPSSGQEVRIAAARYDEKLASTTGTPLFTFTASSSDSEYILDIIATKLDNAAAGYTTPMTINLLIGVEGDDYPVRLAKNDSDDNHVFGTITLTSSIVDADGDGIDDDWEDQYFLDNDYAPTYEADATSDYDGDGYSDVVEYQNAGTMDANGNLFNPLFVNAEGGTGYNETNRTVKLGDLDGDDDVTVDDLGIAFSIFSGAAPDSPQQVSAANVYYSDGSNAVSLDDLGGLFIVFSGGVPY